MSMSQPKKKELKHLLLFRLCRFRVNQSGRRRGHLYCFNKQKRNWRFMTIITDVWNYLVFVLATKELSSLSFCVFSHFHTATQEKIIGALLWQVILDLNNDKCYPLWQGNINEKQKWGGLIDQLAILANHVLVFHSNPHKKKSNLKLIKVNISLI